jgi:hypothetical protein
MQNHLDTSKAFVGLRPHLLNRLVLLLFFTTSTLCKTMDQIPANEVPQLSQIHIGTWEKTTLSIAGKKELPDAFSANMRFKLVGESPECKVKILCLRSKFSELTFYGVHYDHFFQNDKALIGIMRNVTGGQISIASQVRYSNSAFSLEEVCNEFAAKTTRDPQFLFKDTAFTRIQLRDKLPKGFYEASAAPTHIIVDSISVSENSLELVLTNAARTRVIVTLDKENFTLISIK